MEDDANCGACKEEHYFPSVVVHGAMPQAKQQAKRNIYIYIYPYLLKIAEARTPLLGQGIATSNKGITTSGRKMQEATSNKM